MVMRNGTRYPTEVERNDIQNEWIDKINIQRVLLLYN